MVLAERCRGHKTTYRFIWHFSVTLKKGLKFDRNRGVDRSAFTVFSILTLRQCFYIFCPRTLHESFFVSWKGNYLLEYLFETGEHCSQPTPPNSENFFRKQDRLTSNANKMTLNKLFWHFFIFRFPTYSSWRLSKKNWKILVLSTFFLRRNIKKLYFWRRLYFWRMSTIPRWNLNTSDRNSLKKVPHNLI